MKKLIIIPAYNESESIKETVNDIVNNTDGFDYIVINDCSTDDTAKICADNNFNYINLPINLGIGGAVQTGYKYAFENGYDIAVQVDGDGQHDVAYLEKMVDELIKENCDMVIGSRFIEKEGFQSSFTRRIGISYFTCLIKLITRKKITDPTSGLRMAGRNVIELFANVYPKDYPEPESVVAILRAGMNVKEVSVIMRERQGGVSSIRLWKTVYYMVKVTLAIMVECLRKHRKKG
ncbi:MAG: glycosyltransferase family 2 protein [Lachnospiraceae bacterium]|nr:glycosyltransferase family 2 protein [Lachnospiraceae bacterium]